MYNIKDIKNTIYNAPRIRATQYVNRSRFSAIGEMPYLEILFLTQLSISLKDSDVDATPVFPEYDSI